MTDTTNKKRIYAQGPLIQPNTVINRVYQQSLAEKASTKNTMIVLPTALGKTIIAVLTAAHLLYKYKPMRILIMAPTRPLILQHYKTFLDNLLLRSSDIALLTGKIPSIYRKEVWNGDARIIFATPQIVRNDLLNQILALENFSLLIFDECHRARKDYAYTYIAEQYINQSSWPLILGLTASPGAEKNQIEEICQTLFIEQLEYRSEDDEDVVPYINPISVEWKYVDLPLSYQKISGILKEILHSKIEWLHTHHLIQKSIKYIGRRDLLVVGEQLRTRLQESDTHKKGFLFSAIKIQSASLSLFHALELLETQGIHQLNTFLEKIENMSDAKKSYKTIINDPQYPQVQQLCRTATQILHPKIELVKKVLEAQINTNSKSKILVFTQYRDTVSLLVSQLEKNNKLKVERFVGQATKETDSGLSQDEQAEIIKQFSDGDLNVLVATSIAEEGLDIPSVDLVIFYEPIPSEIRYIQRKGRTGRKTAGKVVILAARDTYDMIYLYVSKRRVEKMRTTITNINMTLQPVLRSGPKPQPNKLSTEELQQITQQVINEREDPDTIQSTEQEVKPFFHKTEQASRTIHHHMLKRGEKGISHKELIDLLQREDDITPPITQAAISKLKDLGELVEQKPDRLNISKSNNDFNHKLQPSRDVYDISVEKVYTGVAVVLINSTWRARLRPHDFDGPPYLIKKNTRFKAKGKLYHEDGKLCLRVHEVRELLS